MSVGFLLCDNNTNASPSVMSLFISLYLIDTTLIVGLMWKFNSFGHGQTNSWSYVDV